MPSTLESCEIFFGSKDLYGILEIEKSASVANRKQIKIIENFRILTNFAPAVKKAYYKQALKVHPDRVPETEKEEATEKFKVLAKIHEVLSDSSRRALYDEQGVVDDDDDDKFGSSWLEAFKNLFKPISDTDIDNYRIQYVGKFSALAGLRARPHVCTISGSELEKADLKKAYVNGSGCINYIMEFVPFMSVEDEPRFHDIIDMMIKSNEVPEFKAFTEEPTAKRDRRHKKYAREAKEAKKIKEKLAQQNSENDLAMQIMQRNEGRAKNFGSFIDKLMEKYGNEDDDDEVDMEELGKKVKKPRKKSTPGKEKKETPIKAGRVSKRNK